MEQMNNLYKYDMHVHTAEVSPCAKSPAADVVDFYVANGYDGIFITDHFKNSIFDKNNGLTWQERMDQFLVGYKRAKEAGDKKGLKVFLGVEFRLPTVPMVEALAVGMTEEILRKYEDLNSYPLERLYELSLKEGFLLFQAHPFRPKGEVQNPKFLHGYEVINGGMLEDINQKSYELCVAEDKLPIAGSDFHNIKTLNRVGLFTYEPVKSVQDFVEKMKAREYGFFANKELSKNSPFFDDERFIHLKRTEK